MDNDEAQMTDKSAKNEISQASFGEGKAATGVSNEES